MILHLYQDLRSVMPAGANFTIASASPSTGAAAAAFPRIVMIPDAEALSPGQAVQVPTRDAEGVRTGSATIESAIVLRALEVVFLCQGRDEDQAEGLLADLMLAFDLAGLTTHLATGTIDWHEHSSGKGGGISALLRVKFPGAFIRPKTWAVLSDVAPEPETTPTP